MLRSRALDFGIRLSQAQMDLLGVYLDELWEWNARMNLTGLATREGIIGELILDALIPGPHLPDRGTLLDVGSGAGFPAIPLKITRPGLRIHCIEAVRKKTVFLGQVVRLTGLTGIEIIRGRIERDGRLLDPDGYGMVTARAFAPLARTIPLCAPHLMPGGILVNFQGDRPEIALDACAETAAAHGLVLERTIPYTLPGRQTPRHVLLFRKGA